MVDRRRGKTVEDQVLLDLRISRLADFCLVVGVWRRGSVSVFGLRDAPASLEVKCKPQTSESSKWNKL